MDLYSFYFSSDRFIITKLFKKNSMRKIYIIMMVVLLFVPAASWMHAQDREESDEIITLLGNSGDIGGYGAFSMRYFQLDNRDGVMFGGRGGVIVGHGISFGITGTGFLTQSIYDPVIAEDAMVVGGYGGIYIEPILLPRFPVHVALPVILGAGGIGYKINHYDNNNWEHWEDNYTNGRGFLLVEPGIEAEFNVMRHFRFALGASYKFTTNLELRYNTGGNYNTRIVPPDALNGLTVGVTFKFGVF